MIAKMLFSSLLWVSILILLPISPVKADAASKSALIDRILALPQYDPADLDTIIMEVAGPMISRGSELQKRSQEEILKEIRAKLDKNKLNREMRDLLDKTFTEQELDYVLKLVESSLIKRFATSVRKFEIELVDQISTNLKDEYKKIEGIKYMSSAIPRETSWLTKLLWKWFPDSNICRQ